MVRDPAICDHAQAVLAAPGGDWWVSRPSSTDRRQCGRCWSQADWAGIEIKALILISAWTRGGPHPRVWDLTHREL
jgi:hypothetical protein